ncbi:MAG: aldo/keto reductase [Myxococcales bacterium]|nr:aldo/keto reductase [Myxococcales bacterium]
MRTSSLGAETVTAIGMGDVSLARSALRNVDLGEVTRALHGALGAGFDLIDVAGDQDSERLVGDAVRALRVRDRAIVATTVPALVHRVGVPTRDVLPARLPLGYVTERIESTLRATRFEALPLAQLPVRGAWRGSSAWPELQGLCARMVREGKVLRWGLMIDEIEDDTIGLVEEGFTSLQLTFNLCDRAAEPVIAAAQKKHIAVLARRPLAGGALAGTIGPGMKLARIDDRRDLDDTQLERIAVGVAKLAAFVKTVPAAARSCEAGKQALEAALKRRPENIECATVAELALRYVLDRGVIALPRLHRNDRVPEAMLAALSEPLSIDLRRRLDTEQIFS